MKTFQGCLYLGPEGIKDQAGTLVLSKDELLKELGVIRSEADRSETERLRKENTILRGLVQCNAEWKCTYGYLGADGQPLKSMGQCPLGFPGCSCGDDLLVAYCEPKDERSTSQREGS